MKIIEIQKLEKGNTNFINLIKEGLFCRAYETSAMLFTQNLKKFKVQKKYYKVIKNAIVFIGFPASGLENIINAAKEKGFAVEENTGGLIARVKTSGITDESFENWKNNVCYSTPKIADITRSRGSFSVNNNEVNIIQKLRSYSLADHTPIETVQFVMQIQKELAEMENAGVTEATGFG